MQKITTYLWFDNQAEEAVNFYVSLFENSRILNVSRYGENGPVMTMEFQLAGLEYLALNGGPQFKFTEAISLLVKCDTQEEIDKYWNKLTEGGEEGRCGWLKDKYGLSKKRRKTPAFRHGDIRRRLCSMKNNRIIEAKVETKSFPPG